MRSLLCCFFCLIFLFSLKAQHAPYNMSLLDRFHDDSLPRFNGNLYNDVWGYVDCKGREYGIIGSIEQIHFIALDEPDGLREVARFPGGGGNFWRDMKTYRDRAYSVADRAGEGLMIFDLSHLPDSVVKTAQTNEFFTNAHNIFIDEQHGRLYVAGSDSAAFVILDIRQNPDQPQLLYRGPLPGAGYLHDIYVRDHIAYCSHGRNGFWVWDLTDATQPQMLATIKTAGYNHSSWVSPDGRYAVYAEESPTGIPLGIIDLSEADQGLLEIVNTFKFPLEAPVDSNARPHNPFIRDHYAVVSYYQDGLQIFDIADPLNPKQVAYYDTFENSDYPGNRFDGAWGAYPFLPSGRILVSDIYEGLLVLSADSIQWGSIEATTLPDPGILLQPDKDIYCPGDTVLLSAPASNGTYHWTIGQSVLSDTSRSIRVSGPDSIQLEMVNGHCVERTGLTLEFVELEAPSISLDGNRLFTFSIGMRYQWYLDGQPIDGANEVLYDATESGSYFLEITDPNGCTARSESIEVTIVLTDTDQPESRLRVGINPLPVIASARLQLYGQRQNTAVFSLFDLGGKQLIAPKLLPAGQDFLELDLSHLAPGLYIGRVLLGEEVIALKILKN